MFFNFAESGHVRSRFYMTACSGISYDFLIDCLAVGPKQHINKNRVLVFLGKNEIEIDDRTSGLVV